MKKKNNKFYIFLICFNFLSLFINFNNNNNNLINFIIDYKFFFVSSLACLTSISTLILIYKLNSITFNYNNLILPKQNNNLIDQQIDFLTTYQKILFDLKNFKKNNPFFEEIIQNRIANFCNNETYQKKFNLKPINAQIIEQNFFKKKYEKKFFQEFDTYYNNNNILQDYSLIEQKINLKLQNLILLKQKSNLSLFQSNGLFFENPQQISEMFQTLLSF